MMPGWIQQLPVDGVRQPKGFFTTALFCWKPNATDQVGGHGPRWARAPRQSARTRYSVPGRGSWLRTSGSVPCQLIRRVALAAGSRGGLFRCISLRGKDVTVTKTKLCCGNDARRKQEKADRMVNGALAEGRNKVQSTPPCMANVPQHPKKHILSPFLFIVL